MLNIKPQYIFDKTEKAIGVFLPIEDWNAISQELRLDLPQWQKDMIDSRLDSYKNNPTDTLDCDEVFAQFDKKDEALRITPKSGRT